MSFFQNTSDGLIIGAGHGIGLSIVKELKKHHPYLNLLATYRNELKAKELLAFEGVTTVQVDPLNESDLEKLSKKIDQLDFIFFCVGTLETQQSGPEKSLRDINVEKLTESFQVNAISFALCMKYFASKLNKSPPTCICVLSAMVGGVKDNYLGGWYGYRASKAALNMLVKTTEIELLRKKYKTRILAIHPGTTLTELSEKYLSGIKHQIYHTDETASHLIELMNDYQNLPSDHHFFKWDGEPLNY